ncbi:MAG: ROK family protein [Candidatus Omnitrophota bacterium]
MPSKDFIVGVDVGGTNVKLGLVGRDGAISARSRLSTESYVSDPKKLISALADAIKRLVEGQGLSHEDVRAVGMGLPGQIDPERGAVVLLPNIPGWKNIPLCKYLKPKLNVPVFLDNDVNLVTLGEWKHGAGRGAEHMLGITLGTGVGGAMILDGRLYRGAAFAAGEIGHLPINLSGPKCTCGSYACMEAYVGNQRLLKKARRIFRKKSITLEEIGQRAKKGEQKALVFWNEAGEQIGAGLVGVVNLLSPQKIVIGGGVSNNHRFIFPAIRRQLKNRAMPLQAKMTRVVRASLGDDAGIIGARVLAEDFLNQLA